MPQMILTITIRKPVSDADQAQLIYDIVKQRLSDRPDLKLSGHCSNHYDTPEEQEP